MTAGPGSLGYLLGEPGPDPLDGIPLPVPPVGPAFDRIGDRMRQPGKMVEAPHRIVDPVSGRVVYGTGELMTWAEAIRWGVVTEPAPEAAPRPKPARGKRRPTSDRAVRLGEDR
jgi:hypothetical protein